MLREGSPFRSFSFQDSKKIAKKHEKIWRYEKNAYLCIRVQGKRIKSEQMVR